MNILMYRWKAYNQYDLIQELERRGHFVDEIRGEMESFDEDANFAGAFGEKLDSRKFDLVITINYFPIISNECQKRGIRYVSWCCDCPISAMYNKSIFNPVNTVFTFDKINQLEFESMNAPVYYLPLCAATPRVDRLLSEADNLDEYDCDVSFIGSMYNKNSYDEVYEHLPDYLKGYFDAAMKMQMNVYGEYLLDDVLDGDTLAALARNFNLKKSRDSFSNLSLIFSTTVLGFKIAQMERKTMLAHLSKYFDVNIYTDDENADFVRGRNCGACDYWEEAPKIFNRSRINLNFTIRNIRSGIPLRIWDIMSAGGFCMTNFQPELLMYFENGRDIVYFEDKKDLENKIRYYLSHEEERKMIAKNGYEKVKSLHNYHNRLDEMQKYIPEL